MLKHPVRLAFSVVCLALLLSASAQAGEFSVQAVSASFTNPSNPNVSCPILDHDSVALTVQADGTVANSNSQATVTFEVRYLPDVGETNLPTVAYVAADFVNFFGSTSSSDEAYVCDITNGTTKVDQADRAIFADSNYGSVIFGQEVQSTALTNVNGVLMGTVSFQTNKVRAAISATGNVATAAQHVSINTVSSSSITSGARQMLNGEARATIQFLSGLPAPAQEGPLFYFGWTLSKKSLASFSAGTFEWNRWSQVSGSTQQRAETPIPTNYGYDSSSAQLTYKVTLRRTPGASTYVYPLLRKTSSHWTVNGTASAFGTLAFIQANSGSLQITLHNTNPSQFKQSSTSSKVTQNITLSQTTPGVYTATGTWTSTSSNVHINGQPGKDIQGNLASMLAKATWRTKLLLQ